MSTRWLDAFPPIRPMQVDTLHYVFPNLAFEHQLAIVKVILDADHKQIHAPWIENWIRSNHRKIARLCPTGTPPFVRAARDGFNNAKESNHE